MEASNYVPSNIYEDGAVAADFLRGESPLMSLKDNGMTLHVFSARISHTRSDVFNITRQTGGSIGSPFAPSWDILRPVLAARDRSNEMPLFYGSTLLEEAWARYVPSFLIEMRQSYRVHRGAWDALLAMDHVVLGCFCTDSERCHRAILRRQILPAFGAVNCGEVDVDYPAYRVAVSGCRPPPQTFANTGGNELFERLKKDCQRLIRSLEPGATVVHGGCIGIDQVASFAALERGLQVEEHLPDPKKDGVSYAKACLLRNVYVTTARELHAWPAPWSRGTWDAVRKARADGVPYTVHDIGRTT